MKPLAPDIGVMLTGAFKDTWPAMRSWLGWLIIVVLIMGVGVALMVMSGAFTAAASQAGGTATIPHPELFAIGDFLAVTPALIGGTFALASSIRTVKPDFRFTAGRFFGFIGYSLLAGLVIMLGFLLLVIPGLYLAIKLGGVPYVYLLGESDPMKRSWDITKDRFWMTVLALIVVGLCAQVGIYVCAIAFVLFAWIPFALFLIAPLAVAVFFATVQFQYNCYARWYSELIKTA